MLFLYYLVLKNYLKVIELVTFHGYRNIEMTGSVFDSRGGFLEILLFSWLSFSLSSMLYFLGITVHLHEFLDNLFKISSFWFLGLKIWGYIFLVNFHHNTSSSETYFEINNIYFSLPYLLSIISILVLNTYLGSNFKFYHLNVSYFHSMLNIAGKAISHPPIMESVYKCWGISTKRSLNHNLGINRIYY